MGSEQQTRARGGSARRWLGGLLLAALLFAPACQKSAGGPPARPRNVILLLVDTLRADHLGLYGYPRVTSPELDVRASSAVVFERARSQAACTFPSINSIFTSRYAIEFAERGFRNFVIPEELPTLAETLRNAGLATFAVSASPIVRNTPSELNPKGGYGRGFDSFDESCLGGDAHCVNARALDFLRDVAEPFFLYLHYMDVHHPYQPPIDFPRRFSRREGRTKAGTIGNPDEIAKALYEDGIAPEEIDPRDVQDLVDRYDDEIGYFDAHFGRFFDFLERRGLLDETLVILAGDHGELFLENGEWKHCRTLFDGVTRTPLVFWVPGVAGRRIETAVENVGIFPTVLDYLGIPGPPDTLAGTSLRRTIEKGDTQSVAFSWQTTKQSADDGRYKLILDTEDGTTRLFDLASDAGELVDLANSEPAVRERLEAKLREHLAAIGHLDGPAESAAAGRRLEERLRSIGYIH